MIYRILCIFILSLVPFELPAHLLKDRYIENLSARDYLGDVQAWDITTDDQNNVFVATAKGMSVYDGVNWFLYTAPNMPLFRCVNYDLKSDRVYTAADNQFGYWAKDERGFYKYCKLYESQELEESEVFWRVEINKTRVLFQTQEKVYVYDEERKTIENIFSSSSIAYLFRFDDSIYLQAEDYVYKYLTESNQFIKTDLKVGSRIINVLKLEDKHFFITEDQGILYLNDRKLEAITNQLNDRLIKSRLFSAIQLNDSISILGSVLDGLFIVDKKLNIVDHINFKAGLLHTTILSLQATSNGDLWLGLDGGMARIRQTPREILIQSLNDDIGSVYDACWWNNELYVATNKGLFQYLSNTQMKFVPGSQGQVWSLEAIDNTLVVCHDSGIYYLTSDNKELQSFSKDKIWSLIKLNTKDKEFLSVDIDKGFSVYELANNNLKYKYKIKNFEGAQTGATIDRFGHIWVQDRNFNPIRMKLVADKIEQISKYEISNGTDSLFITHVDNDALFIQGAKAYTYDIAQDALVENTHYTLLLEQMLFKPIHLTQLGQDNFFYASRLKSGYIKRYKNEFFNYGEIFQSLDNYVVPLFARKFIPIDENTVAMGIQGGISFYSVANQENDYKEKRNINISRIEVQEGDSIYYLDLTSNIHSISNAYSNIKLYFNGLYVHRQVVYSIDGQNWQYAKGMPYLQLPHLRPGKHTIKLKNMEPNEEEDAFEIYLNLKVDNPWYYSSWFLALSLIILILISLIIRLIFKRRIKQQRQTLLKEQTTLLQKEKHEYELKILKLKLKEEEKQLINLTMENVKRNAMLNDIRKEATARNASKDLGEIKKQTSRMVNRIDYYLNNNETQELFEKYFNTIHDGFYDRLLKKHPEITQNEIRLSTYIKLNLNSKEIAAYMNISPNSVEVARYRLRKKIGITQDINLQKYISEI